MAEDTALQMSFAWAGTGELKPTNIEDNAEQLVGLDRQTLLRSLSKVAPHLAEAKARLAEELSRHRAGSIFSYEYHSEIIHQDGSTIPIEHTVVVLQYSNGDGPLVVGVIRESCPVLRQITDLCRKMDDEARRLVLRLAVAIAAA